MLDCLLLFYVVIKPLFFMFVIKNSSVEVCIFKIGIQYKTDEKAKVYIIFVI